MEIESETEIERIENKIMPFHIKDIVHMCLTLKELGNFIFIIFFIQLFL